MSTRRPAWKPGDFATFEDRFRRTRTGIWTGESETQTTRLSATGQAIPRKVPLVTYSMLTEPAVSPEHPGHGSGSVSVDVRKLRPATAAEIAASPVREGWAACQARQEAAHAWWAAARPASDYLIGRGYGEAPGMLSGAIVNVLLEADRLPGRYAYTADRKFRVIKTPDGRFAAGPVPVPVGKVLGS